MIKNEAQLRHINERLDQIEADLKEMRQSYSDREFEFWAGPSLDELSQLRSQVNEFQLLKSLTLSEAIEGRLRKPTPLEDVGQLLAKLRITSRLTQQAMAERLRWQQANVSRFESENYSSQTVGKIVEYVAALGARLYLIPSLDEPEPLNRLTIEPVQIAASCRSSEPINLEPLVEANTENEILSYQSVPPALTAAMYPSAFADRRRESALA